LPVELEEYFKRHDGQSGGARAKFIRTPSPEGTRFRLLRIEEVVREWRVWNELLVAGEFAGRKSIPDAGVRDDWYNRGWVPLTENGEGDHHSRSS
jgi:cell wall assembly regulator SMI1